MVGPVLGDTQVIATNIRDDGTGAVEKGDGKVAVYDQDIFRRATGAGSVSFIWCLVHLLWISSTFGEYGGMSIVPELVGVVARHAGDAGRSQCLVMSRCCRSIRSSVPS